MRYLFGVVLLGTFMVGCVDNSDGDAVPDSELRVKFTEARDGVMPGDPWSEETRRIEELLGPPKAKSEIEWRWATVEAGECFDLRVKRTGVTDNVGGFTYTYATTAEADAFERCRAMVQAVGA